MPLRRNETLLFNLCVAAIAILPFFSCHPPISLIPDHPRYFDSVYHRLDSLSPPPQQAFRMLDSSYYSIAVPGIIDQVRRYDYKGYYYFYQAHDLANSMLYVDSSLQLLSTPEARTRYPQQYAKALLNKGEIFQYEKNYENALFYYYKGRQAIDLLNDSCTMAEYTQRLAMASFRQTRFADARNFFEQALHEYGACKQDFRSFAYEQSNINNIGESYAAMKRWDSAAWFYDSALRFIDSAGRPYGIGTNEIVYMETARGVIYGDQGDCFLNQHDTAKAAGLYQKSIDINLRARHDSDNALSVLVKLADLHLAQHQLNQARQDLDRARATLDHRHTPDVELTWQRLQSQWLEKTGDLPRAYKALDQWVHSHDSLNNIEQQIAVINFPSELQRLQEHSTIQLLEERDHVKTYSLVLAAFIVALLLIILFLIRRNEEKSRNYILQLNQLNHSLKIENQQTRLAINALNESQVSYLQTLKVVAHDLRNPVAAISSAVAILDQQAGLNNDAKTWLELIRKGSEQSLKLVDDIMQLDLPLGALNKEPVPLAPLLESCVSTLQFRASEKRQTIVLHAENMIIRIDQEKIWRVIINLLDNAIKFSPEEAAIEITSFRQANKAVITVTDKGIGIPEPLLAKLFTVDNQSKRKGTAGENSFGLGLVIVRQIIQAHGGSITVQSKEKEGTTFRIELYVVLFFFLKATLAFSTLTS
jgi:signal transduction histidine kinase